MNKLISIIIPIKNGEKYLKEALDNIKNQNMNVEIVVVNDGSDDTTENIAKNYGCVVINKEKSEGPVKAKNDALKIAKGEYILFHDHDDLMRDNALKTLYDEIIKDENISAVEAKVKDFISPDVPLDEAKKTKIKEEAYYGLFTGAILIKKSAFDIIGPFNENVTAGEIIDWQGKMDKNDLKIKKIDFISTDRRIHLTNFGKTQQKTEFKDYAALLRAKIRGNFSSGDLAKNVVSLFRSTSFYDDRKKITDQQHKKNTEILLENLEENAKNRALNLINKLEKTYKKKMVPVNEVYNEEELKQLDKIKQFENEPIKIDSGYKWKNYILPINLFESSVFYYRHGLDLIKNCDKINEKAILDCGAYIADSALVFRNRFNKAEIRCFEPTKSNYELALKTVQLNNLKNIKIENLGLGDKDEINKIKTHGTDFKNIESTICSDGNEKIKITTIDSYVQQNNLKVGLIKTDVEGYEQKLLQGARQTICKQKPILLISIYHSYDDFYKIKPLIENWNLGYRFDFFQGIQNSGDVTVETMLIAQI